MTYCIDKTPVTSVSAYRPDIDGLRAIAVLAVILYHFKISFFSGGFVGVDIFFVISGYLITKGILSKQSDGKFEFADFYFRRVRRLIPALLATIVASYIVALLMFSPADFKQMSGSTVYALTGLSNIFFWRESGYFDTASSVKPLLHTWSLSVEIQFYILWPLMLLLVTRFTTYYLAATLALIVVGGTASVFYLNIDSSGAFFLTPFRMHEFLFGALVVLLERFQLKKYIAEAAYLIGLLLVAYPVFFFSNETTLFPGFAAMVPAAGAALMILAGANSSLAVPCRSKVATKIGEISYSLYLVHWPIFVFTSYVLIDGIPARSTVLLIIATFLLAVFLYCFIEKPFRNPNPSRLTGTEFSLAMLGCSFLMLMVASTSWGEGGWDWRVSAELRDITKIDKPALDKYVWDYQNELNSKKEFDLSSKKEKILIIGDSQAADIANMLSESGYSGEVDLVSRVIMTDCNAIYMPDDELDIFLVKDNLFTVKRPELIEPCKNRIARATSKALLDSADKIFIAFQWRAPYLQKNIIGISRLLEMTRAKVFVFGRKDLLKSSIDIVSSHGRRAGVSYFASRFKNREVLDVNQALSSIAGIRFVDMMDVTCSEVDSCNVLTGYDRPVFFDTAHLTREGAAYLAPSLLKVIAN